MKSFFSICWKRSTFHSQKWFSETKEEGYHSHVIFDPNISHGTATFNVLYTRPLNCSWPILYDKCFATRWYYLPTYTGWWKLPAPGPARKTSGTYIFSGTYIHILLVVSTPLWKNISQNGNLPQIGVKKKKNNTTQIRLSYTRMLPFEPVSQHLLSTWQQKLVFLLRSEKPLATTSHLTCRDTWAPASS